MPSSKLERSIYQLFLRPATRPHQKDVPEVSFDTIIDLLKTAYNANMAFAHLMDDGQIVKDPDAAGIDQRKAIYIADWKTDPDLNRETILFHKGDPDEVNPSFVKPTERTSNTVQAAADEAPGRSAHLIINRDNQDEGHYRALLEKTVGLNRGVVFGLLNHILTEMTDTDNDYTFQRKDKKGNFNTIRYAPQLRVSSPLSASLEEDIKGGVVESIELIKRSPKLQGIDFDKWFKPRTTKMTIAVSEDAPHAAIMSTLNSLAKKKVADELQIKMRDISGGKSASPRHAVEMFEAQELLYARLHTVTDFEEELDSACEREVSDILVTRMGTIFTDGRW